MSADLAPVRQPEADPTRTLAARLRRGRLSVLLLRERGWALALLGVIVLSIVFVMLGRWQYGRHEGKVARNATIDRNYSATPVPLSSVLASATSALSPAQQWRQVRVTGRYEPRSTKLIRNRPLNSVYGYEVVVPLRQSDGSVLLVDRGWIPNGSTGAEPDSVPAPPDGEVNVVVRMRPGEPELDRAPPPGQELRIDIPRIASGLGTPVYQAYGVLAVETPTASNAPTLLPRPDEDLGPHFGYAVQWWGFAAAAYVVLAHFMSRETLAREGLLDDVRSPDQGPGGPAGSQDPQPPAGTGRRRRMSDEEWEDAATS